MDSHTSCFWQMLLFFSPLSIPVTRYYHIDRYRHQKSHQQTCKLMHTLHPPCLTCHQHHSINVPGLKWNGLLYLKTLCQTNDLATERNAMLFIILALKLSLKKKRKKSAWWQQIEKESISWNMPGSLHLNSVRTAASVTGATSFQFLFTWVKMYVFHFWFDK